MPEAQSSPDTKTLEESKQQGPSVDNEANNDTPTHAAWRYITIVASGCLVMFTTCAFIFTFGVYQSLYEKMSLQPNTPFTGTSTALIDLIGTLAIALMSMGGPFAMSWAKQYSPQAVIIAGGWLCGIALILASFSKHLWHFALTQGVLLGLGVCMAYVPTMSVAPTWFDRRRGLAMGIIISGTGIGGMVWPPALRAMIAHVGFRNALRISGCISLAAVSVAGSTLSWEPHFATQVQPQTPTNPETTQTTRTRTQTFTQHLLKIIRVPLINWRVACTKRFIAQAAGCFIQSAGYSTPLFFYAAFARTLGYSETQAANFITISNASNFVSRIIIGHAADRWGRLNALFMTTLLSAVAVFAFWLPATFYYGDSEGSSSINQHGNWPENGSGITKSAASGLFIVFTILYGAFASAYISLFPASLIELFGKQQFTSVNGALYLIRGIGALLGTPLTGMLIPESTALEEARTYERAAVTVGVLLMAASGACWWVRVEANAGQPWKWKA